MTMATETEKTGTRRSVGARRNPETEAAILNAAAQLIAEKGLAGFNMQEVAKRAKAGKATLYRWWPTRGALILAVYKSRKPNFVYKDTGSLLGDLTWFANELTNIWKGEIGVFFKAIIAEAQSNADIALSLDAYRKERLDGLIDLFIRAEKRGECTEIPDLAIRAELLMSFLWQRLMTNQLDQECETMMKFLADLNQHSPNK